MTRPAWLEAVAEICGGEPEDWREIGAHGGTWRWRDRDDTKRKWSADSDSVWYEGGGLWVEARCCSGGEPDHARLARAVLAGLAVARGDLDVDALQQQVATLTRERDELAARLAGPVGPLVPDAVGWWWLEFDSASHGKRIREPKSVYDYYEDGLRVYHYGCWIPVDRVGDAAWLGPVAPPRGAR